MKLEHKKKEMAQKMYDQAASKHGKGAPSGLHEYKGKKGKESVNSVGKRMDNLVQEGKNEQEKN